MSQFSLTEKEESCLSNAEFLRTKRVVVEKNIGLLYTLQEPLRAWAIHLPEYLQPYVAESKEGKVSQGENYQDLPYQILDWPRLFTPKATFALRSMIWWGQYYSLTLHLGGEAWQACKPNLQTRLTTKPEAYVGIGDNPFEHHFGPGNYAQVKDLPAAEWERIWQRDFFKLGDYWPLSEREHLQERILAKANEWIELL